MNEIDAAVLHAREAWPTESVGLFYVRDGQRHYRRCTNVSSAPGDRFVIAPAEFAEVAALGEVIAVVHSHPGASGAPSVLDQAAHAASGLQWLIVGLPSGPDGPADMVTLPALVSALPLLGRRFVHGATDCYSLVRDWYWQSFAVVLPDFVRDDHWWQRGGNLYLDHFAEAGFVVVAGPPQHGDLLLMQLGASVPNHGAVYLAGDRVIHHLVGRLSSVDVYGKFFRERTTHVLRHVARSAHDPAAG
ncbi:C40 family peptidase [Jeongeupia naejangsanensis]|uniref:C40 family peptidase n=1 Tax=Jeongeupia naejangsanensis TaxID=613195 RepID=A0ABS2BG03_9NEIS|nr:C40 family peptidase [Jeongeupia naejangsanensis]MBM3114542.1 C40 family peptidase [Jeongeupia naejangsanensis]